MKTDITITFSWSKC